MALRSAEPAVVLFPLVATVAIYRIGWLILRKLRPYLADHMRRSLHLLWLLVCLSAWAALTVFSLKLAQYHLLYEMGRSLVLLSQQMAGEVVVTVALGLIAWNLVGEVSRRIVPQEAFSRRSVRVATLKNVVQSTLKAIIVLVCLIGVLQALGVNATSLLAGVSVLGLAVGFGAQSLIRDVFTGFFILLEEQYGVGDYITINTGVLRGFVEKLNFRVTILRDIDGTVHIVPNGQIVTVSVASKDWSQVVAAVKISPKSDLDAALEVLRHVSQEMASDEEWGKYFLVEPDVQGVSNIEDTGLTIRALFKVEPLSQWMVQREFNRRIKLALDDAGIELAFGHRTVMLQSVSDD